MKRHFAQVSAGRRQRAELAPRNSPRPDAQRATESAASRPSKASARSMAPSDKPAAEQFYTTSRVRLRTEAGVGASTVAMLEQGQAVTILGASGKWRWVSTAGRKGWVHGDYIALRAFHGPRPKEMIVGARANAAPKDAFSAWSGRSRMAATRKRPARPPQRGDCQCPYDFMIDGNQLRRSQCLCHARREGSVLPLARQSAGWRWISAVLGVAASSIRCHISADASAAEGGPPDACFRRRITRWRSSCVALIVNSGARSHFGQHMVTYLDAGPRLLKTPGRSGFTARKVLPACARRAS